MRNSVTVEDWGLSTLDVDSRALLEKVMDQVAEQVAGRMKANMAGGGPYSTGKAAASVKVWGEKGKSVAKEMARNVGPTAFYAYWLEMGWVQVMAWGQALKAAIYHPGRHFARDALQSVAGEFEEKIAAAMRRLGR